MRVGFGYDCHRLASGKKLILGGIEIPSELGVVAHSDGDVLIHALCDAILGSASLGDIGTHFPDWDKRYEGIESEKILVECMDMLRERRLKVVNVDATIILEQPKLGPFRKSIIENLSRLLKIPEDKISVKAKTKEGMDSVGKREGIEAYVVILVDEEGS